MKPNEQFEPASLDEATRFAAGLFVVLLLSLGWILLPKEALSQRQPGSFGIGFQVGRPGGAALKMYRAGGVAYDGILTTDADDYVAGHFHRLWERAIPESPLYVYAGPGTLLGVERLSRTPRLRLGLSTELGLNFYAERFEVFLHVTPSLRFLPDTQVHLDGNVGLRYYFRFP